VKRLAIFLLLISSIRSFATEEVQYRLPSGELYRVHQRGVEVGMTYIPGAQSEEQNLIVYGTADRRSSEPTDDGCIRVTRESQNFFVGLSVRLDIRSYKFCPGYISRVDERGAERVVAIADDRDFETSLNVVLNTLLIAPR
jgi:hypothetical protein